ncbi:MAG TPA: hypothetical protein VFG68_09890 [Fimbriiglobus sp.]|nr:hypothetical protein [Fimbriiglobus sp.]
MPITIRDETTAATLAATDTPQELLGPDGQVLGRFLPAIPGMRFPEFGVTDEEMDRRLNDPNAKWVTGDEVMARLRSLRDVP